MARKQLQVPGTERKTVKELDDAASFYVQKRDERIACSTFEKDAKNGLIAAMKKHKVETYRCDTTPALVVQYIPGKEGVKVTEAEGDKFSEYDEQHPE